MSLAQFPYDVMHWCGKPALHLAHEPMPGVMLRDHGLCTLAGRLLNRGDQLMCGSCGRPLTPFDFDTDNIFKRADA